MSYILDALKKAEAERKLGSIPNVYTQALPGKTAEGNSAHWQQRLPWLLAVAMAFIVAALLIWMRPWQTHTPQKIEPAPTMAPPSAPVATITPPPAPVPVVENLAVPPQPLHHDISVEKTETKPAKLAANKAPDKPPVPSQQPVKKEPLAAEKINTPPALAESGKPEKKNDATHAEDTIVGTQQDLPANIQRELPPVVVNGYIYSKNPADSSVLINKKLLREGDQIAPDLVLEKMMPKSAILNYKGYRYRIAF